MLRHEQTEDIHVYVKLIKQCVNKLGFQSSSQDMVSGLNECSETYVTQLTFNT